MTSSVVVYHVTCMMLVVLASRITGSAAQTMDTNPDFPTHIVSSCLPFSGNATVDLSCSTAGQLVKLVTLFYGHGGDDVISAASIATPASVGSRGGVKTSRTSQPSLNPVARCHFAPGDCVTHLPSNSESISCVGHRRCSILIAATDRGKKIPGCQLAATYAQAVYQCVPESAIVDVCNRAELLQSTSGSGSAPRPPPPPIRGYLRTPFYPDVYPDNVDCNVTIEAARTGQRVRLFVVDMALETNGTGCADWLQVFDGARSATLCGFRARSWLAVSAHAFINVRVVTNERRQLKGFWLYYEAQVTSSFSTSLSITPSGDVIASGDLAVPTSRMTSSASSAGNFPSISAASYPFPTVFHHSSNTKRRFTENESNENGESVIEMKARLNSTAINDSSHTSTPAAAAGASSQFSDGPANNNITGSTSAPPRIFTVESSPKSNAEKWRKNRLHNERQSAPKCTNVFVDYPHSPGGARNSGAKRRDAVVRDNDNRCSADPSVNFLKPQTAVSKADDQDLTVWSTRRDCGGYSNDLNVKPSVNWNNGL